MGDYENEIVVPEPTQGWMFQLPHETPEVLRNEYIPRLNKLIEGGSAALGITLATIYATRDWSRWQYVDDNGKLFPYDSFYDFCRREIARSVGTCTELRLNWEYFHILHYGPDEFIRFASEIGWSKVREMRIFRVDRGTVEAVREFLAQGPCTRKALRKQLQDLTGHGPIEKQEEPPPSEWVTLQAKFAPDQWEVMKAALEFVQKQSKTKDVGQALIRMATGYLASIGRRIQQHEVN